MGKLKRSLGWKVFGLYGLGNIVGAGIYVLIGEVAAEAGNGLIWSFAVAGVLAGFTAVSYAALSSKFPVTAAEVVYIKKAFNTRHLGLLIGLILVFSGLVSAGVLLNGFANYLDQLVTIPRGIVVTALAAIMGVIAARGIKESAAVAVIITIVEVLGLLIVVAVSLLSPGIFSNVSHVVSSSFNAGILPILFGGFLAFYAFIGFEDMVNVAEEVKNPERNVKRGMFVAVFLSLLLYACVGIVALGVIPAESLAQSEAPLADVFRVATGSSIPLIPIIGLFAIVNGILAQIIMTSRILHGLSREDMIPHWFGATNRVTHTPVNATVVMTILMILAALSLPLSTLAMMTSFALLIIFCFVHLACLKLRDQLNISPLFPAIGLTLNVAIITIQLYNWFFIA